MQQEDHFISNSCMTLKEMEVTMQQKSKIISDTQHKQIEQKQKNHSLIKERSYSLSRQYNNYNNDSYYEFDTEEAIKSAANSLSSSTIKLAFSASTALQVDSIEKNPNKTQKYLDVPNVRNDRQSLEIQQQIQNQCYQQEKLQSDSRNSLSKTRPSIDYYFHFQQTSLDNISLEELTSQDAQIINELSKKIYINPKNSNQIEVIKRLQTTGIKNNQFMQKLDEIPQLDMDDLNLKKKKQNSINNFNFQSSENSNREDSNIKEECLSQEEVQQQRQQSTQNHIFSLNISTNEYTLPQSQNCNKKKFTQEIQKSSHKLTQIQQDLNNIEVVKENSFNSKNNSSPNSNECIPSDEQDYFSQMNNIGERLNEIQEKRTLESDISLYEKSSAVSKPSSYTEDKQQEDFTNENECLEEEEEEEISQEQNENKLNFIRRICDSSSLFWKQFTEKDDDYLLSLYEKLDKNNVNKNILSSFLKYILDNGDDVVVECLDSKQKDLNIIRKELKNFTRNKKLNNNTINSFFNSQRYSEQFQYFLKFYAIDYFTKSKVKDKASHYICVAFFLRCFFNNKLREKIIVYNKSKYFKSLHKNRYSAKQNQIETLNNSQLIN